MLNTNRVAVRRITKREARARWATGTQLVGFSNYTIDTVDSFGSLHAGDPLNPFDEVVATCTGSRRGERTVYFYAPTEEPAAAPGEDDLCWSCQGAAARFTAGGEGRCAACPDDYSAATDDGHESDMAHTPATLDARSAAPALVRTDEATARAAYTAGRAVEILPAAVAGDRSEMTTAGITPAASGGLTWDAVVELMLVGLRAGAELAYFTAAHDDGVALDARSAPVADADRAAAFNSFSPAIEAARAAQHAAAMANDVEARSLATDEITRLEQAQSAAFMNPALTVALDARSEAPVQFGADVELYTPADALNPEEWTPAREITGAALSAAIARGLSCAAADNIEHPATRLYDVADAGWFAYCWLHGRTRAAVPAITGDVRLDARLARGQ